MPLSSFAALKSYVCIGTMSKSTGELAERLFHKGSKIITPDNYNFGHPVNGLRLGHGSLSESELEEGIIVLGKTTVKTKNDEYRHLLKPMRYCTSEKWIPPLRSTETIWLSFFATLSLFTVP